MKGKKGRWRGGGRWRERGDIRVIRHADDGFFDVFVLARCIGEFGFVLDVEHDLAFGPAALEIPHFRFDVPWKPFVAVGTVERVEQSLALAR